MPRNIFFQLLILSGIWTQEIIGAFADEEIKESSDFLVRQKRVVTYVPGEDISVDIVNAPYVVYIKRDERIRCMGTILSPYVVITSAQCILMEPRHYIVVFGSSRLTQHNRFRNVIETRKRIGDPHHTDDGIVLLIVDSKFPFSVYCQPIEIYAGPLLAGSFGKIHGWGYNFRNTDNRGTENTVKLRSIEVPIILHENCVNRYRPHMIISDRDFCTYHAQRHSGHTDFGAGLVVDGQLTGIFLWSGPPSGPTHQRITPQYPDVFVSLQNSYYNNWITINLNSIASYFANRRYH